MKLAPPQNTLQPLPPDVHADVSETVQRTATPADIQTIQNVQSGAQQSSSFGQNNTILPVTAFAPSSPVNSVALWIALIVAALIAGALVWFWRTF
jgi:hypothetical protein